MLTRRAVLRGLPLVTAASLMAESVTVLAEEVPVLSDAEMAGVVYMREEEKLARDVYAVLYGRWQTPVFATIQASETRHMAAMKTLLDRYGVEDPADGRAAGVYQDGVLQSLYDDLVVAGQASLAAALTAGTTVEEIDILDLEERLAQTDESAIQRVYQNLLAGSYNHLRAFVRQLGQVTGAPFVPQYLSPEAASAIVETGVGPRGRRWGGR